MKNTIKKYGIYAAIVGGVFFISSHYFNWGMDYSTLEFFGYASIFASLLFVFFGIKHFRDRINNGIISFNKAFLMGLAISAISGIMIGILDFVYVKVINPDFFTEYTQYMLEGMQQTLSAEQFEVEKASLEAQMETFAVPGISGLFMFVIVFLIGIMISLVSALILQRKK